MSFKIKSKQCDDNHWICDVCGTRLDARPRYCSACGEGRSYCDRCVESVKITVDGKVHCAVYCLKCLGGKRNAIRKWLTKQGFR